MGKAIQTAIVKVMGTLDPSVAKSVAEANKKFSGIKAGVAVAGAAIAGATTAAVAFGKTSLDAAAKFETGMSNVATLLDGDTATVNKRIAEMGDDIMGVAKKTGVATDDLANGMYQIVSAMGDSADASKQVEVAAKAAKAGGATTVDAINLLSAVVKGYGTQYKTVVDEVTGETKRVEMSVGESWEKASDLAFQTVKLGQTSFPELASSMGKVVPIASALNISQEELFGSFATLTGVTGSTAEVSTQLKSVFSGLMTPSTALSAKISELGFESANAMLDQLGLIGTLDKLSAACGDDKQAVAKLFSSVEAQTAILALAGSQTENWVQKTEAMAGAADATSNAFDKSTDNLQGKLDKMKQVFETFKIRVGNILIPIVTNIVDKAIPKIEAAFDTLMPILTDIYKSAQPVIQAFANAIPGALDIAGKVLSGVFKILKSVIPIFSKVFDFAKKGINWIIDDSKILMPVLSGVLGGILAFKAVNSVVSTFNSVKKAITGIKTAMVAVKALMVANPVGLIIAGVVAVSVALVMLYKKCEPFRKFINGIGAGIKKGFLAVVNWFKGIPSFFGNLFSKMGEGIKNGFNAVINWFKNLPATFSNIFNRAKNIVDNAVAKITEKFPVLGTILGGVIGGIKVHFNYLKTIFSNVIGFIKNVFTGNWKGALENVKNLAVAPIQMISGLFDTITNTVKRVLTVISEKFPAIAPIIQGVQATIMPIIESIKGVFNGLIDFIKNVFTGNWAGAWESVKNIFGNAFSALKGLAKAPLNAVISLINKAIGGLNKLSVTVPDWVPGIGGQQWGFNIPQIPMLATGGIATQPSICGEGGYPEYVISTDPKYREQNQKTVLEAASAIGALETARNEGSSVRSLFKKFNGKGSSSTVNNNSEANAYRIEFSPVINISGNTNNARSIADEVMRVFDDYAPELADKIKAVLATAREGSYGC